jgi:hypothetical protein
LAHIRRGQLPDLLDKLMYLRNPRDLGLIACGVVCVVALVLYIIRRRRVSAEEMERRRRAALAATGRIIDGVIIDAPLSDDLPTDAPLLIGFKYRIAGVVYECSQDVSTLQAEVEDFRVDLPVSIKYDPRNPANSIVVSESWSGLRNGTEAIWPAQRQAARK